MINELSYKDWNKVISNDNFFSYLDIYYTPNYYDTWKKYENAEPTCLFYETRKTKFLYSFFKKEIKGFSLKKKCYDVYTAYGYGGILTSNNNFTEKDINDLNNAIDKWCLKNDIISEFVRENFIFYQKMQSLRDIQHYHVRTNIYSNLKEDMVSEFSKHAIRDIKKAKKNNLEFFLDKKFEYLNQFIALYTKTMKKLNASKYFYFNKNYFNAIKRDLKDNAELLCVFDDGLLIASNICLKSDLSYIYHLGSSLPEKLYLNPNDFLVSKMFHRGKKLGCHYLSLGGGISNKSNDSLFRYKKKFGTKQVPIYIGKKIHDEKLYYEIQEEWENKYPRLVNKYKYFLQKHLYTTNFDYLKDD